MAELKPSSSGQFTGGVVLGAITGAGGGAVAALLGGLATLGSVNSTSGTGSCWPSIANGLVVLGVSAVLAAVAWYSIFRLKAGFIVGLLRGASLGALVMWLVPWPCSYSFMVLAGLGTCRAH